MEAPSTFRQEGPHPAPPWVFPTWLWIHGEGRGSRVSEASPPPH